MVVLRRHQLVWLSDAGWRQLQRAPRDAAEQACIAHWASHHLPLVVTQQPSPPSTASDTLALGLAAPGAWGRRKIALQVPLSGALYFGHFPLAPDVVGLLVKPARARWLALCAALRPLGVAARVHGSHGWQRLTGLHYLHATSDLDLHLPVETVQDADAVAALLQAAAPMGPRIDGELVFGDGTAVAWREWLQWRQGRVDRVLVKRLHGVALEAGSRWLPADEHGCDDRSADAAAAVGAGA